MWHTIYQLDGVEIDWSAHQDIGDAEKEKESLYRCGYEAIIRWIPLDK